MTFNEYQELAKTTAIYPKEKALEYVSLGLASECGEICGKIKKTIRDNNSVITEEKRLDLLKEAGDQIWYISQLITELNGNFEQVAKENIDKLFSRKDRGKLGGSGDER